MDLLAYGIVRNSGPELTRIEIPSIAFVKMCEKYIAEHPDYRHSPL